MRTADASMRRPTCRAVSAVHASDTVAPKTVRGRGRDARAKGEGFYAPQERAKTDAWKANGRALARTTASSGELTPYTHTTGPKTSSREILRPPAARPPPDAGTPVRTGAVTTARRPVR